MGGSSWCCGFKSNKHSFFHSFFKVSSFLSKNDTKFLVTNNRYQSNLAAARMGAERQVESYVQPAVRWSLWSDQRSFLIWWRRVIQSQMKARYSQLVNSNGWQHRSWRTWRSRTIYFSPCDRTILETMLKKKTSKEIWDSMRRKYQGSTRVKRAQLQAVRRDFEILQMQKGEMVNDYIDKVMSLASQMRMHGDSITDVAVVEKI